MAKHHSAGRKRTKPRHATNVGGQSALASVPSFLVADPWNNQTITLYHGTVDVHVQSIRNGVTPASGRRDTDFGQGFYATTVLDQAKAWAWGTANRLQTTKAYKHRKLRAVVLQYKVSRDRLAGLESMWFVLGTRDAEDLWSLITHCRSGAAYNRTPSMPWYDLVIGPVASQWRSRQTILNADQISFHTKNAVSVLETNGPPKQIWIYP